MKAISPASQGETVSLPIDTLEVLINQGLQCATGFWAA